VCPSLTLQIPDGVAARGVQRGEGPEQHSGERAFPLAGPEHRHRRWQRRRPHALGHGGRVTSQDSVDHIHRPSRSLCANPIIDQATA
jgi:hypothetical protein